MFEHLAPSTDTKIKQGIVNSKLYLPILFAAILLFVFVLGISKGPDTLASEEVKSGFVASLIVDANSKQLVANGEAHSVFDFVIDTNEKGAVLYKLKIKVDGVYDFDTLGNLKLYHQGVQLGSINRIDRDGNMYFDLLNYILPAGRNHFSISLPSGKEIDSSDVFQFSIASSADVSLMYEDSVFLPQGNFPTKSGAISFVEQGQLLAYNKWADEDALILSGQPQKVAVFSLVNKLEKSELADLTIGYYSEEDLSGYDFVLVKDKQFIAEATADEAKIDFVLDEPIVLEGAQGTSLELHALGLPEGKHTFDLLSATSISLQSGKELNLAERISLNSVSAIPYFMEFINEDLDTKLSNGWNEVYDLTATARGVESLNLHKLSWQINSKDAEIMDVEIWVDNQPYIADLILEDDGLVIKTNWEKPLQVSKLGTNIKLLVDLEQTKQESQLEVFLLNDKESYSEDKISNILWSSGEELSNGYQLPYLPLQPNILNN